MITQLECLPLADDETTPPLAGLACPHSWPCDCVHPVTQRRQEFFSRLIAEANRAGLQRIAGEASLMARHPIAGDV